MLSACYNILRIQDVAGIIERLAHAATHAAQAAGIEVQVAVHRLLLVGRIIDTYRGEYPKGSKVESVTDVNRLRLSYWYSIFVPSAALPVLPGLDQFLPDVWKTEDTAEPLS